MSDIGVFERPEDLPWHELSVELFGTFVVQAPTPDAAWLKLGYACHESFGIDFVPEQQLPFLHTDRTLTPRECIEQNRLMVLTAEVSRVITRSTCDYYPIPTRQYPEYSDWLRQQTDTKSSTDNVISLAEVASFRTKKCPNVA